MILNCAGWSRRWQLWLGAAALAAVVLLGGQVRAEEPLNLDRAKNAVRTYLDSGEYEREINAVADKAVAYLEQRAKQGGTRLTVLFDVDETMISNLPLIRSQDFAYIAPRWIEWVAAGKAPVIDGAFRIYQTARRLGFDVIFLTGRRERDRPGTEKNLRAVGCGDYAALIVKPDDSKMTTGLFKSAERKRLIAEGRVIVANVGDQDSDFIDGGAERDFKLPNPLYLTR